MKLATKDQMADAISALKAMQTYADQKIGEATDTRPVQFRGEDVSGFLMVTFTREGTAVNAVDVSSADAAQAIAALAGALVRRSNPAKVRAFLSELADKADALAVGEYADKTARPQLN